MAAACALLCSATPAGAVSPRELTGVNFEGRIQPVVADGFIYSADGDSYASPEQSIAVSKTDLLTGVKTVAFRMRRGRDLTGLQASGSMLAYSFSYPSKRGFRSKVVVRRPDGSESVVASAIAHVTKHSKHRCGRYVAIAAVSDTGAAAWQRIALSQSAKHPRCNDYRGMRFKVKHEVRKAGGVVRALLGWRRLTLSEWFYWADSGNSQVSGLQGDYALFWERRDRLREINFVTGKVRAIAANSGRRVADAAAALGPNGEVLAARESGRNGKSMRSIYLYPAPGAPGAPLLLDTRRASLGSSAQFCGSRIVVAGNTYHSFQAQLRGLDGAVTSELLGTGSAPSPGTFYRAVCSGTTYVVSYAERTAGDTNYEGDESLKALVVDLP
ncbi:MAG: hypothetical protein ACRDKI_09625 [Solirubrobacterales bacterium]